MFIDNRLPVCNGSFNQMLTSKNRRVNFSSELHYIKFQRPHDNKKRQPRITLLGQLKVVLKLKFKID